MIRITTKSGSRKYPSWIAKITGKHPQYKYNREFLNPVEDGWTEKIWELVDGLFQVCDGGNRKFIKVENDQLIEISEQELLKELEK